MINVMNSHGSENENINGTFCLKNCNFELTTLLVIF